MNINLVIKNDNTHIIPELTANSILLPENVNIPKYIFIVPYRSRKEQKFFFCKYMSYLLEDFNNYEIYFSHQNDRKNFNRGAMRNIGFMVMKKKYPDHYKNINFIFNDVDTLPFNKIFDYETKKGIVKHYYGFRHALGGIVVFKGEDFEKINGYPNYWGWGGEDDVIQKRCISNNLEIDRTHFYELGNPEILQLFDGVSRIVTKNEISNSRFDNGYDGISTLSNLIYTIDNESKNMEDNIFTIENKNIYYINVYSFLTGNNNVFNKNNLFVYDLRKPVSEIANYNNNDNIHNQNINYMKNDWSNIPNYPLPQHVIDNIKDPYAPPPEFLEENLFVQPNMVQRNVYSQNNQNRPLPINNQNRSLPINNQNRPLPINNVPHIYSPQYASYIGSKPKATPSAKIRLGGVY
jgi:hypothetical protein